MMHSEAVGAARPPPAPSTAGGAPAIGTDYEYGTAPIPPRITCHSIGCLGGIFDSTIPCNSVYNLNHYLCLYINTRHISNFKHFCFKIDMFFCTSFLVYSEAFKLCVILSKFAMYIDIKIEISGMSIDMQK